MRARLVPFLLAMTVLASGCAAGGEPEVTAAPLPPASPSPSPTATAEAEAVAGEVPPVVSEATPQGAADFVRGWFVALNQAAQDGDPGPLQRVSDPACETCNRFIGAIDSLYESGGRIDGGQFSVKSIEVQDVTANAQEARALVVYDVTPTRQVGADEETILEVEALSAETGDLLLSRTADGWRMQDFS